MRGRITISSGAPWEEVAGYSRAVRVGDTIHVAGTTATDSAGEVIGVGDAYAQTRACITKIERALQEAGASLSDVVRTRMFVVDIDQWETISQAHREAFGDVRPAATLVEVSRLIDPYMIIEIEAVAMVPSG
ncbi:MAG: RidA family protein [Chloroflexi bacterium]|nr:RidA family protein [Chloroflexota bacterium]